jgi:soluble P-type ATPase
MKQPTLAALTVIAVARADFAGDLNETANFMKMLEDNRPKTFAEQLQNAAQFIHELEKNAPV